MTADGAAGEARGASAGGGASRRVLDPVSRASEVLFGLIMVMTFTLSLGASEAGRDNVRAILIGVLGCNLAWAIIDAAMYLMGTSGERRLAAATVRSIRSAESPALGRAIVAEHLPPAVLPALTEADLERVRRHLGSLPPRPSRCNSAATTTWPRSGCSCWSSSACSRSRHRSC